MSAEAPLECAILEAGHCVHLERVVLCDGRWRLVRLPVLVGVVRHPTGGVLLFDTGLAPRVRRAASGWPRCLYRWLVPFVVTEATSARAGLAAMGITADEVSTVVVSHFHPDHVGGLRDFPRARVVASPEGWHQVDGASTWRALRRGHLRDLLPDDLPSRLVLVDAFDDEPFGPFPATHDLFGDGRVRLVPLPGHAAGQVGLLVAPTDQRRHLFVADACWVSEGYRRRVPPSRVTRLFTHDPARQNDSLALIHAAWRDDPGLLVVPSHCPSLAGDRACA